MTEENRQLLNRINQYAETALAGIDPQKVQVSAQLDKLRPVMQEIAGERGMSLEDVFILYMDLQSEAGVETDKKMRDELGDINKGDGNLNFTYR